MSTPRWTKDLPSEQGSYWWWNEDEDSAPIHIEVYYSGCENSYFAPSGQYGWTVPQDVRDMGGWWMWLDTPNLPTSGEQDASTETELADMTALAKRLAVLLNAASGHIPANLINTKDFKTKPIDECFIVDRVDAALTLAREAGIL